MRAENIAIAEDRLRTVLAHVRGEGVSFQEACNALATVEGLIHVEADALYSDPFEDLRGDEHWTPPYSDLKDDDRRDRGDDDRY